MNLATINVGAAAANQTTTPIQFREGRPDNLAIQGNFTYGSGGTTMDAWVQSSLDGGNTWIDVCNFHFTTASARFVFNLSALTAVTAEYTPTDGTLAANTAKDGILGNLYRAKWTSVGTYAGGTTLSLDAVGGKSRIAPQS